MLAACAHICCAPRPPRAHRAARPPARAGDKDEEWETMGSRDYEKNLRWVGDHHSWKDTGLPLSEYKVGDVAQT